VLTLYRTMALLGACALSVAARDTKPKKQPEPSALERYVEESDARSAAGREPVSPGSLWRPGAALENLGRDFRASQVDDIITIVVAESASALSSGTVKTQRNSAAKASVNSIGKQFGPQMALPNLVTLSSAGSLDGQGSTARQTMLSTEMSARVVHVLANGNLVIEGKKAVQVNSEQQMIVVRGVVRPIDLGTDNSVRSERLAEMEVTVNGKGVVGDAIRRPMILYRILLGLLPF
jgi:flagellar L-ring protein FlgH